jgi:uncharacterized membrane protein YjjP (DUF1212 family)
MLNNYIIKLLVLFLLLSQFVTLAHAIEHQLDHEDDLQCLICIHETENQTSLVNITHSISSDYRTYEKIFTVHHLINTAPSSYYSIRSPPLNLI